MDMHSSMHMQAEGYGAMTIHNLMRKHRIFFQIIEMSPKVPVVIKKIRMFPKKLPVTFFGHFFRDLAC